MTCEVRQNVHATDPSRKTPANPEEQSLTPGARAYATELQRREAAALARARGKVHRHLRLVAGQTRQAPRRGNRTARQILAAIEDEIAKGRRADWSGSRARAKKTLERALVNHGSLPGDRAWREGLRVAAASTGLVVIHGHSIEIRFGVAAADTPDDRRMRVLENGHSGRDSASVALSVEGSAACDTPDSKQDSSVLFDRGPTKERVRVNPPKAEGDQLSFSEWSRACGSTTWGGRVARLLLLASEVHGTTRDAARALLRKAMGKVASDARRYVLRTDRPVTTPWPTHLARQTVLRGIERALTRLLAKGLVVFSGNRWSLPDWADRADLSKRGIAEVATVQPSRPSEAMVAHLQRQGIASPETLSEFEAKALNQRLRAGWEERRRVLEPRTVGAPSHCPAIVVMRAEADQRGWRVGPDAAVEQLDRLLKAIAVKRNIDLAAGQGDWCVLLNEHGPKAQVVAPYLLAVLREIEAAWEASRYVRGQTPQLPAAPMQRAVVDRDVKPENLPIETTERARPVVASQAATPVFVRTSPLRPWEVAAEEKAKQWGRRKAASA